MPALRLTTAGRLVGEELVGGVLIGLEDPDLDDLAAGDPVDVRAPDLHVTVEAGEPLADDQRDTFVAGQHVDQLDLDLLPLGPCERGVDVGTRGLTAAPLAG